MTSAVKAPFQVFLKLHITWGYLCPGLCARKRHEIFRLHNRGGWDNTQWNTLGGTLTEGVAKNWFLPHLNFRFLKKNSARSIFGGEGVGGGNTLTMQQTIIQENYKCDQVTAIESNLKPDGFFPKKFSII